MVLRSPWVSPYSIHDTLLEGRRERSWRTLTAPIIEANSDLVGSDRERAGS